MEPKPVERHVEPKYPTRRDVMLGAGGFLLIELVACTKAESADPAEPAAGRTIVAPIFKHGEGRGATGCIVVAPPVFLSEEEAMQIIREELAKHGVKLGEPMILSDVRIAARTDLDFGDKKIKRLPKPREDETSTTPFKLGGVDRAKKVGVRFVSEKAYHDLGGVWDGSTVQTYDLPEVTEYVAAQVKKQGKTDLYVGLLYDPLQKLDFSKLRDGEPYKEAEARVKVEAEDLLRKQSRDFAAWLTQRKAI
jgi:hypothetical protein